MRQSQVSRPKGLKVSYVRRLVLFLTLSGQLLAQSNYAVSAAVLSTASELGNGESFYELAGANRTQVPFELIDNRPVFHVRLNASDKDFRFVLDTGSHMTVISKRTAARLNLRGKSSGGQATGVGGKFDIVRALLWSCEVGEVRLNNVPVFIRDISNASNGPDGYIGLTFISQFVTSVDYGERILTLERPGRKYRSETREASQTPIRITPSGIVTNGVRLDGIADPMSFILDTGATVSVIAKGTEALISSNGPGDTLRVHGAGGVQEGVNTIVVSRLRLGDSEQADLLAAILDLRQISEAARSRQMGILGGNFLRHFKVVFDVPGRVVRLSPLSGEIVAHRQTALLDSKTEVK